MSGTTIDAKKKRMIALLGLALAALLMASLLAAKPAHANSPTIVNSTADLHDRDLNDGVCDGDAAIGNLCTFRAALEQTNATPGLDLIDFQIPGSGVHTISPSSPLPTITDRVIIDGYSQPGATQNTETQPGKTNASPMIELNGSNAGSTLLSIHNTSNTEIRGLVINRFIEHGIVLDIGTTGTKIEGNFIGTGPAGTEFDKSPGASDNLAGIEVAFADDNTIGGTTPEARNIISATGIGGDGVRISGSSANNKVQGNLIGTAKDGISRLANEDGVDITDNASDNTIGGDTPDAANTIALNFRVGVRVGQSASSNLHGNRILSNSIVSNCDMGIDLASNGLTSNDLGDNDAGPNNLQNFPVISSAKTSRKGTTIKGTLNSTPNTTLVVQLFSNPKENTDSPCNNPPLVQGKTFIGQKSVTTDGDGNASFAFKPKKKVGAGQTITATATNDFTGDTSEFSAAKKVVRKR